MKEYHSDCVFCDKQMTFELDYEFVYEGSRNKIKCNHCSKEMIVETSYHPVFEVDY